MWSTLEQTMGHLSLQQLAYLIIIWPSHIDYIMDCIACIDKTTTSPLSPPPRY